MTLMRLGNLPFFIAGLPGGVLLGAPLFRRRRGRDRRTLLSR